MSEPEPIRARWRELIDRHLLGAISDDESRELEAALAAHREVREEFRRRCNVDAALRHEAAARGGETATPIAAISNERTSGATRRTWFQWRPLAAAAAGIVFGMLCTSVVWAYALPMANRTVQRTISTLTEGFENEDLIPHRGFPRQANEWSGDLSAPVTAESGVVPIERDRMARLEQSSPNARRFSYAWRIVDLAEHPAPNEAEMRKVEVSAAFNTAGEARPLHYQIRLAAFSQEPGEVRRIWNHEPVLFDTVLQHVGRNVRVGSDDPGWQTVQASMEIPPGTRSLLISLAASEADSASAPKEYYLDDVQVRFVVSSPFKH